MSFSTLSLRLFDNKNKKPLYPLPYSCLKFFLWDFGRKVGKSAYPFQKIGIVVPTLIRKKACKLVNRNVAYRVVAQRRRLICRINSRMFLFLFSFFFFL